MAPRERFDDEKESATPSTPVDEKDSLEEEGVDAENLHYLEGKGGAIAEGDVAAYADAAGHFDLAEARAVLEETVERNKLDPNFPAALLARAREALKQEELSHEHAKALVDEIKLEAALMDDSPYVEVRAVVPNTDDPTIPVSTFRAWFVGIIFVIIGSGVNEFFSHRFPSLYLNVFVAQLLAYPAGKLLEKTLPEKQFTTFGRTWTLNPGPFNYKEHMLITIMANVTFGGGGIGSVYTNHLIIVQRLPIFYNDQRAAKFGYQILMALSTQMLGFGVAGLNRRFLVYPAACIWPTSLATVLLNRSFHGSENTPVQGPFGVGGTWVKSRIRVFLIIFVIYGLYSVLPAAVFDATSYFNWITWIKPEHVTLALITGSIRGLGLNPIPTFDYAVAQNYIDPFVTPLFAMYNKVFGTLFTGLFIILPIYFTNTWYTAHLPLNSNGVFNRNGTRYKVARIVKDLQIDEEAYRAYSPPYLAASNAQLYAAFFAFYTSGICYVILYYRKHIATGFKGVFKRGGNGRSGHQDVHNRLMQAYKEVPEWWFGICLVGSIITGCVMASVYETKLPIWGVFFAAALCIVFVTPVGLIYATTNTQITMNVLAQLVAGYVFPGKPVANMLLKSFGVVSCAQAVGYCGDLKLGHYTKLPPRTVFWAQILPSLLSIFVAIGVVNWQISNIDDFCSPDQKDGFTCPSENTVFTASVIWGVVGPSRMYSAGGIYQYCMLGFLAGAVLPIPVWLVARKYPTSIAKYIHIPVMVSGALDYAPTNLTYAIPALYIAMIFNGLIKSRYLAWWSKYNYVVATALGSSMALFGVIWFFGILYKGYAPVWWGTTVPYAGCDFSGCPYLPVPEGGFGPAPGEFS